MLPVACFLWCFLTRRFLRLTRTFWRAAFQSARTSSSSRPSAKAEARTHRTRNAFLPSIKSRFSAELRPLRRLKIAERLPWARTTIILLGFSDT